MRYKIPQDLGVNVDMARCGLPLPFISTIVETKNTVNFHCVFFVLFDHTFEAECIIEKILPDALREFPA